MSRRRPRLPEPSTMLLLGLCSVTDAGVQKRDYEIGNRIIGFVTE